MAVTKTYPASDVEILASLGITDVAENKDQDAAAKAAAVSAPVRWHFVGRLQRNKAKSVVRYARVVESVDSVRLVAALSRAAVAADVTPLDVLIQVSLDGDSSRGGAVVIEGGPGERAAASGEGSSGTYLSAVSSSLSVPEAPSVPGSSPSAHSLASSDISGLPDSVGEVATAVAEADGLRLRGVMAVAPIGWDPEIAFRELAGVAARIRVSHPGATDISAGMSGDLEAAIKHGATHVRIGTSLLGMRNTLR